VTRVRGGQNIFGHSVGILMLDTHFPRIPGDMGNAATFDFPVLYHRVRGASPDRVVRHGQRELLPAFIEGARALEREGVAAVSVPVFTSSLLLVPLVHRMLAPGRAVGIMTVDATSLRPEHFTGAGISKDIPTVIAGMETEKEFTRVLLGDQLELDVEVAREEHLTVARRMLAAHPEIGALVLECTNMPPYRADLQAATGLAVFDITTLVRMVHDAVSQGLPPRPA
jgi:hypothetical protein